MLFSLVPRALCTSEKGGPATHYIFSKERCRTRKGRCDTWILGDCCCRSERHILCRTEADYRQVTCHCYVVCISRTPCLSEILAEGLHSALQHGSSTTQLDACTVRCRLPAAIAAATCGPGAASEAETAAKLMLPPMYDAVSAAASCKGISDMSWPRHTDRCSLVVSLFSSHLCAGKREAQGECDLPHLPSTLPQALREKEPGHCCPH